MCCYLEIQVLFVNGTTTDGAEVQVENGKAYDSLATRGLTLNLGIFYFSPRMPKLMMKAALMEMANDEEVGLLKNEGD